MVRATAFPGGMVVGSLAVRGEQKTAHDGPAGSRRSISETESMVPMARSKE